MKTVIQFCFKGENEKVSRHGTVTVNLFVHDLFIAQLTTWHTLPFKSMGYAKDMQPNTKRDSFIWKYVNLSQTLKWGTKYKNDCNYYMVKTKMYENTFTKSSESVLWPHVNCLITTNRENNKTEKALCKAQNVTSGAPWSIPSSHRQWASEIMSK